MLSTLEPHHEEKDVAQTLASMFLPSDHSGCHPIDHHQGQTRSAVDACSASTLANNNSASILDSKPSTLPTRTTRRSTTRGRKLAALTPEDISDLAPEEQVMVMGYSRKYQQKAAALFRVLRLPNAFKLTSKTLLKPCDTCASQDWPCVLVITNNFGIRKQISRCVGCRHTRSTCSLKDSAKDWEDAENRMPWEFAGGDEAEPSFTTSAWGSGPSPTPGPAAPARLPTEPVGFSIPPLTNHDIEYFLNTIAPRVHELHTDIAAAIFALAESVGAQIGPAVYASHRQGFGPRDHRHSADAPSFTGPYSSPPPPRHAVEHNMDPYYFPAYPTHQYESNHEDHYRYYPSDDYDQRRRFSSSDTESPASRLKTPLLTPVRQGEPLTFHEYSPMNMSPLGQALELDTGAPQSPEPKSYTLSGARTPSYSTGHLKGAVPKHNRGVSPYAKPAPKATVATVTTPYDPRPPAAKRPRDASPNIEDAHILLTLGQGARSVSVPAASTAAAADSAGWDVFHSSGSRATSETPAVAHSHAHKAAQSKRQYWRTE